MKSQYYDLGQLFGGETVIVSLSGNAADVRLLDSHNLEVYKNGGQPDYCGGWTAQSPARLTVGYAGHWHVLVDFGEYRGVVKSHVQVLPGRI